MLRVVGWLSWIVSLVFLAGWGLIYAALSQFYAGWANDWWNIAMTLLIFAVAPALLVLSAALLRREQLTAAIAALATAWLSFTTLFLLAA